MTLPPDAPRTFYRIVRRNPPDESDFFSLAERGRPLPPDVNPPELWKGVSAYASVERARVVAQRRPHLGRFLARVETEPGALIRIERTGNAPEHYTLWASPALLLARVSAVEAV